MGTIGAIAWEVAAEAVFGLLIVFGFKEITNPRKYLVPKVLYGSGLAMIAVGLAWLKKDSVLILLAGIVTPEVFQSLLDLRGKESKDHHAWLWAVSISLLWLAILSRGLYSLKTQC